MVSLHDVGWRQGSIIVADLPLVGVRLSQEGAVVPDTREHGIWIVATQDCDLVQFDVSHPDDVVELRPIFEHAPPATRGIRSQKCLLIGNRYVEARSRRTMVSPQALTSLLASGVARRDDSVANNVEGKTAFKTWLGLRYDRPAVPPEFVRLATRIAQEVDRQAKTYSTKVRDVLVQFEPGDPLVYLLYAVVLDIADSNEIVEWLTGATLRVPPELGILGGAQAGTDEQASLRLIETSFAVDLTQITWGGKTLRGEVGRLSRPVQAS